MDTGVFTVDSLKCLMMKIIILPGRNLKCWLKTVRRLLWWIQTLIWFNERVFQFMRDCLVVYRVVSISSLIRDLCRIFLRCIVVEIIHRVQFWQTLDINNKSFVEFEREKKIISMSCYYISFQFLTSRWWIISYHEQCLYIYIRLYILYLVLEQLLSCKLIRPVLTSFESTPTRLENSSRILGRNFYRFNLHFHLSSKLTYTLIIN